MSDYETVSEERVRDGEAWEVSLKGVGPNGRTGYAVVVHADLETARKQAAKALRNYLHGRVSLGNLVTDKRSGRQGHVVSLDRARRLAFIDGDPVGIPWSEMELV